MPEFEKLRPRLLGIAYRMLGSRADAEDVVQDAWLRWHAGEQDAVRSFEAWMVTIVTRLCIDRLRMLKAEREHYTGPWLPEPWVDSPEDALEQAGDVSTAFLLVLERLAPEERAIFLLHDIFEFDHGEIAAIVGKGEDACRKSLQRARERVKAAQPRFAVSAEHYLDLLGKFVAATRTADRVQLAALFTDGAHYTGDGGGKVSTTMRTVVGRDKLARLFEGLMRKFGDRMQFVPATVNGAPGLLKLIDGELDSAMSFDSAEDGISAVYVVRNPDKLRFIPPRLPRRS